MTFLNDIKKNKKKVNLKRSKQQNINYGLPGVYVVVKEALKDITEDTKTLWNGQKKQSVRF